MFPSQGCSRCLSRNGPGGGKAAWALIKPAPAKTTHTHAHVGCQPRGRRQGGCLPMFRFLALLASFHISTKKERLPSTMTYTRLLLNVWITGREQISAAACVRRFAESLAPCIRVRSASRTMCVCVAVARSGLSVTPPGRAPCHALRFSKDRETTLQIKGVATWTGPNQLMAAL